MFLFLFKTVFKAYASVEYQIPGLAVLVVNAEVAKSHKLEALGSLDVLKVLFSLAVCEYLKRVGVEVVEKASLARVGVGHGE